jgi:hypothetical protein
MLSFDAILLLGWTAALTIVVSAGALAVLGLLVLLRWVVPAGSTRTAVDITIALLGLALATLLLWG